MFKCDKSLENHKTFTNSHYLNRLETNLVNNQTQKIILNEKSFNPFVYLRFKLFKKRKAGRDAAYPFEGVCFNDLNRRSTVFTNVNGNGNLEVGGSNRQLSIYISRTNSNLFVRQNQKDVNDSKL